MLKNKLLNIGQQNRGNLEGPEHKTDNVEDI